MEALNFLMEGELVEFGAGLGTTPFGVGLLFLGTAGCTCG